MTRGGGPIVSRRQLVPIVPLFALALLLVACFDLEQVDVNDKETHAAPVVPLLIDNFDHEGPAPISDIFGPWSCEGWVTRTCAVSTPGFEGSPHGFSVTFEIADDPNVAVEYQQAGMRTWRSSAATLDVTPYRALVFSSQLEPRELALGSVVEIRLSCAAGGDHPDVISYIQGRFSGGGTVWDTHALPIGAFKRAAVPGVQVDVSECATRVDGIGIYVQPDLANGQKVSGTLKIDNVYLQ